MYVDMKNWMHTLYSKAFCYLECVKHLQDIEHNELIVQSQIPMFTSCLWAADQVEKGQRALAETDEAYQLLVMWSEVDLRFTKMILLYMFDGRRGSTVVADDRSGTHFKSETQKSDVSMVICSIQPLEKCDYYCLFWEKVNLKTPTHRFGREVFSPHFTWWPTIRIDPQVRIGFVLVGIFATLFPCFHTLKDPDLMCVMESGKDSFHPLSWCWTRNDSSDLGFGSRTDVNWGDG